MSLYKHIIWDWNGTLLDDIDISINAINYILKKHNKDLINLNFHENNFCFPIKNYYKKLSLPTDNLNFFLMCNEFASQYNKNWKNTKLQKNAIFVLNKIKSKQISQSILSAQENTQLNKFIQHYQIKKYFSYVIGLNNNKAEGKIKSGKKHLLQLKIPPKNILLIGDTNYDHSISEELGIDCILFYSKHQSKKILKNTSNRIIESLEEILFLI